MNDLAPSTKHNAVLDSWKFIFACLVVCLHSSWFFGSGPFVHGYLVVEYFFMVSGYFLAKQCLEKGAPSPFSWWLRRLKSIFTTLLFSLVLLMAFRYYDSTVSFTAFWHENIDVVYEMFGLQCFNFTPYALNGPDWFVGAMMTAGFLLVSLFALSPKFTATFLVPAFLFLGNGFITAKYGHMDIINKYVLHSVDVGVIRALADMSAGILVYQAEKFVPVVEGKKKATLVELLIVGVLYFILINQEHSPKDFLCIPVFAALMLCCFRCRGYVCALLETKPVRFLSQTSMAIYCSHVVININGHHIFGEYWGKNVYMVSGILFGIASFFIVAGLEKGGAFMWKRYFAAPKSASLAPKRA